MISVRLLAAFAGNFPRATFIEVGANDGELLDPLQPYIRSRQWRGIMVEPVPYLCERLRRNYAAEAGRVAIENVAVAATGGRRPFYYLRPEADGASELPYWYEAVGSFDREHLFANAGDDPGSIEALITEIEVPCVTLEELCANHGIESLDLLLIDAEGYDWEIIRSIDLGRIHPRLLVYEHFNLSPEDSAACEAKLRVAGYELVRDGLDTWCLDLEPDDHLSATWSKTLNVHAPG